MSQCTGLLGEAQRPALLRHLDPYVLRAQSFSKQTSLLPEQASVVGILCTRRYPALCHGAFMAQGPLKRHLPVLISVLAVSKMVQCKYSTAQESSLSQYPTIYKSGFESNHEPIPWTTCGGSSNASASWSELRPRNGLINSTAACLSSAARPLFRSAGAPQFLRNLCSPTQLALPSIAKRCCPGEQATTC
jgi:hypothetical protein